MTWMFAVQVIYIDLYEGVSKVDDEMLMPLIFTFTLLNILMLTKVYINISTSLDINLQGYYFMCSKRLSIITCLNTHLSKIRRHCPF